MSAENSTGTRARVQAILASARPGDMVVVAVLTADGGATIHVELPDARRLVDLGSSVLDQAADMLRGQVDEASADLCDQIEDALGLLPDRFAEPGAEAWG